MTEKVIVIGGGLGGLSAAILLAKKGFDVHLFEKNERLGGKMNYFSEGGFSFDTGPSLITMPFVIEKIFDEAGFKRNDFIDLIPINPICRYFWPDGTSIDTHSNAEIMKSELNKISGTDAENYEEFLQYTKRIYDLTADIFLFSPIHELLKIANFKNLKTLFEIHKIDPFRTVHQGVSRFFKHPYIVQLFDRYATYNGSNPYQAPATLNIIPYVEYGPGCFYIKGGLYRLVDALSKIATQLGVAINTSTPVEKILYNRGKLKGVIVKGQEVPCKIAVCNADVVTAFNQLIDGFPSRQKKLNKLEPSLSGLVFLWGVNKTHSQLKQHNIIFSENYENEFKQIFEERIIPDDPTVYIAITSKTDTDHAPIKSENWFVLINVPYLSETTNWEEQIQSAKRKILSKLMSIGIDIKNNILTEKVITPVDFYRDYGSNRGSIYGISSNQKSTAFRRPPNRSRDINGLYFAGGSTHPGGGVPLAILSGNICADLITEKFE